MTKKKKEEHIFLSKFKDAIFQEILKPDQIFHFKWKVHEFVLLGIKCP